MGTSGKLRREVLLSPSPCPSSIPQTQHRGLPGTFSLTTTRPRRQGPQGQQDCRPAFKYCIHLREPGSWLPAQDHSLLLIIRSFSKRP